MDAREPEPPNAVVIKRLKEIRGKTSGAEIARQMTELGIPWDRNTVAKLENGRRTSVSVNELMALAYILDVSPLALLLPAEGTEYDVAAAVTVPAEEVYRWIVGQRERRPDTSGALAPVTAEEEEAAWFVLRRHLPWLPRSPYLQQVVETKKAYERLARNDDDTIDVDQNNRS